MKRSVAILVAVFVMGLIPNTYVTASPDSSHSFCMTGLHDSLPSEMKANLIIELAEVVRLSEEHLMTARTFPLFRLLENFPAAIGGKFPIHEINPTDTVGSPWTLGYWRSSKGDRQKVVAFDNRGKIFVVVEARKED